MEPLNQLAQDSGFYSAQKAGNIPVAASSGWHNLTSWAANVTRYAPRLEDIVWAGPRMFKKLGSYISIPESMGPTDDPSGNPSDLHRLTGSHSNIYNLLTSTYDEPVSDPAASRANDAALHGNRLSLESARGLGSVFSYATSKWALSCVAMAIVLNRTQIFAATRRRLRLLWHTRLLLRAVPIVLLGLQSLRVLQSIQCQTSPDFSLLRWGDASKSSEFTYSIPNAFLNRVSSTLLLGPSDQQSCESVGMVFGRNGDPAHLRGSLSLLWPLFGILCLSHFMETVSCAVQGRPLTAETGMTLFEQSLAFAEADAIINNQLSAGAFSATDRVSTRTSGSASASVVVTRSMVLGMANTSPEVLLIAFLSSMTHLSSHMLALFDLQSRYRLLNTGFWALCFMGSIVWSAFAFELGDPSSQSLLRFPTVCIIGFVPHVLVLGGISTCLLVYCFALLLSALAPPSRLQSTSFWQRIKLAHENMQANVSLSEIRITREMDFYTALLRAGFAAITMASEAVYLNEDRGVSLQRYTWLEEARFREADELQRQAIGIGASNFQYDQIGTIGLVPVKEGTSQAATGYGRERAAQKLPKGRGERTVRSRSGSLDRSSRWLMAIDFLLGIGRLIAWSGALLALWFLGSLRIRAQPSWLLRLARRQKAPQSAKTSRINQGSTSHWQTSQRESTAAYDLEGLDVESEFRRLGSSQDESSLDSDLYSYWLKGGWWGSKDLSGDYEPDHDDDWDTTSVVSSRSDSIEEGTSWISDQGDDDGQGIRTPRPHLGRAKENTNDSPLDASKLARLLHPSTTQERDEAHTLAAHLRSEQIMTRSRFRRREQLRRGRVLLSQTTNLAWATDNLASRTRKMNSEDEEHLLEQIILSRRQEETQPEDHEPMQYTEERFVSDGLPCVVCQSSARTIIVWPCRCLSLCDDCRVSLAMNNFDKCVCCRRDVLSFSRIFVP